jgi:uncharacterized protein YkwD
MSPPYRPFLLETVPMTSHRHRRIRPVLVTGVTAVVLGGAGAAFAVAPWAAKTPGDTGTLAARTAHLRPGAATAVPTTSPVTAATPAPTPTPTRTRRHRPPRPTTSPTPISSAGPTSPTTPISSTTTGAAQPTRSSGPPSAAPTTGASSGGEAQTEQFQAQVLALTNAERAKAGCTVALTADATLTRVAQAHAEDMLENDFFSHDSQDGTSAFARMTAAGYRYSRAAENIAAGQRTPESVMTTWMNSSGHKANILDCALTELGVGYAAGSGATYGQYWVQDFGTPR